MTAKQAVEKILKDADITINGNRAWDIQIHDQRFYARVLSGGSLAFGESYMDGWWDCDNIDVMITKILESKLDQKSTSKQLLWNILKAKLTNMQSKKRAYEVGQKHYDIGNNLYELMLDKRLVYSCGYWRNAKTLDKAQEAKLDLCCKKLGLKKGMRVLDIGCGWGSFAQFAAKKYGVTVVGVTISKEQVKIAKERCKALSVDIRLQDYRKLNEKFDRIVSIGMFEHVGYKNYHTYMKVARRCLKDDGLFLLHTIGGNRSVNTTEPWIHKYIFPNSMIPSVQQIANAIENKFIVEDWHNFGVDYDTTLMAWHKNFVKHWPKIKSSYDQRFYRMWVYYLLMCAATFRVRNNQLWQIVLSKDGVKGGHQRVS